MRSLLVVAGAVLALVVGVSPALGARFVGSTYGGAKFVSGGGPFEWSFESGYSTGQYSGVAYRLSTESAWHRCLYPHTSGEIVRRVPERVVLSGLPEGTYTIEIADDQSKGWLQEHGVLESSLNTCGEPQYPGFFSVSSDSFTVQRPAVPVAETPATPHAPSSPVTEATPPDSPAPSTPTGGAGCPRGSKLGHVGGRRVCLRAGQPCSWRHRSEYRRYGLTCVRKGRRAVLVRRQSHG
jgi:hypothetical protein